MSYDTKRKKDERLDFAREPSEERGRKTYPDLPDRSQSDESFLDVDMDIHRVEDADALRGIGTRCRKSWSSGNRHQNQWTSA